MVVGRRTSTIKKINVRELSVGMYLHDLCGSWLNHPFWRTSFLVEDASDVQRLLDHGIREVWIDTARGMDVRHEPAGMTHQDAENSIYAAPDPANSVNVHSDHSALAEELKRAEEICRRGKAAVAEMFRSARLGKALVADQARPVVADIVGSVLRHPGALVSLAHMKFSDYDTFMHSVAVGGLMVALGRQLGLDTATLHEVGLGGILHDVGKTAIPPDILSKKGSLTDNEYLAMKAHPVEGNRILKKGVGFSAIARDVCLHHHEKMDGTGYPDRLKGEGISLFSRMCAVCDVYEAVTADRCYRAGWNPGDAIRKLIDWCPDHLDKKIFHAFVKAVGIYPIGSLVRLESGQLAVVIEQSPASVVTPVVKVFYSTTDNCRVPFHRLELATAEDSIVSLEDPRDWLLSDVDAVWHLVLGLS